MSGDVQPRKRKDKKKKKDELGVEEHRGTAAALGEGDVFIHSQQDHGTGGHWCAKIIFFSLLAVLITLIGLIILENRGLTDLEAKAVESRYSGVLEGWIEDGPDDDHHDEHTLDLKHHDDEGDEDQHNVEESDHDEDEEEDEDHDDEEDNEEEDHDDEEDRDEDEESHEEDTDADEDEIYQDESHEKNTEADEDEEENVASKELDSNEEQDDEENQSDENLQEDDDNENNYNEDDDEDDENDEEDDDENDNDEQNNDYDNQNYDDDDQDDNNDNQNDEDDDDDDHKNSVEKQNDDDDEQNYNDLEQNDARRFEDNNDRYGDDDDDYSKELNTQDGDLSNEVRYENDNDRDDDDDSNEQKYYDKYNEDEEDKEDNSQEDDEEEIEKIEKEIIDEDEDSNEILANKNAIDDQEVSREDRVADDDDDEDDDPKDQDDDDVEPPIERITAQPAGKPFVEIEEEITEKPVNTLAEEEEYEKRQEQLRREEEEAAQGSQMWLKLAVGGALLAATHAVVRRATARTDIPEPEEHTREETPTVDRRMTIVPEQSPTRVQESPLTEIAREIEEEVFKKPAPVTKYAPIVKKDSEEEIVVKKAPVAEKTPAVDTRDDKELYSEEEDEEEVEDEEEEEEEDIEEPVKQNVQKKAIPVVEQKPAEDSEPEDVEIIDDEQLEEELEDEENEDEEEISDVDDTELLTRLEAKYGRLPEPERFGRQPDTSSFGPKHKDGGNSIEDEWPGEPSDAYWRAELDRAEDELRQGSWSACSVRVGAAALAGSGRARWLAARALERGAEARRDNGLLSRAIAAHLHLLKMNERLSDQKLLEVARRAIERIQFRGTYLSAEPIYRLLIRRFPDDVNYRNNLTVSFLMANRADLADEVLKETLRLWPNDRVALAHHGFVLKTHYNKLEQAVRALYKALEGDAGPANEPRFYYHLGDALLLLGRPDEAHAVHVRGAALGHFLSPAQRSLYNVPRLRSRAWWPVEETPYVELARTLERSWRDILEEGEAAQALYEQEREGLKERGEWTQLELFVRGAEVAGRCARAPVTCAAVRGEPAAARCRRGQVKFSALAAGTHVRAHVGPTNCRLRMHLGLSNTDHTYIRVDKETRQWQTGKTFIFDDSFEHEVWHNGSGTRLVLIVDVWHPDLTAHERRTLPAI